MHDGTMVSSGLFRVILDSSMRVTWEQTTIREIVNGCPTVGAFKVGEKPGTDWTHFYRLHALAADSGTKSGLVRRGDFES